MALGKSSLVSRLEVLLFTRQKLIIETGRPQRLVREVLKECLYINCCISWPLVSYSFNFFSSEDPRKYRRGRWWSLTSRHRRYPSGILLWFVVEPKYWSNNKKILARTYVSIGNAYNWEYSIIWPLSGSLGVKLTELCCIIKISTQKSVGNIKINGWKVCCYKKWGHILTR
jgi:hypothetical protein